MSQNFSLNKLEITEANKFSSEHKKCESSLETAPAIGGRISYIFTPTALGVAVTIRCNCCGKEQEITDISTW